MAALGVMYAIGDDTTDKLIIFLCKYIAGLAEVDSIYTYHNKTPSKLLPCEALSVSGHWHVLGHSNKTSTLYNR